MKLNDRGAGKVDSCDLWCHSDAEIGVIRNFAIFFAIIRNLDIWCCRLASQSHSWKSNRNFECLKKMFCSFFCIAQTTLCPLSLTQQLLYFFTLAVVVALRVCILLDWVCMPCLPEELTHIKDARVCSKAKNRKPLQFQEITIKQDWDPTTGNGLTNFRG